MAKGLKTTASVTSESAEGSGADELGGASAMDVIGVELGKGDEGREEGFVEGEDGSVGMLPTGKGAGEGRI